MNNKDKSLPLLNYPFVSVLVAARNEERNIESCLQALLDLDYPNEKIEILIGDDASEDTTANIVKRFCATHSTFRLIEIREHLGLAKGKANVLAHLAKEAKGDYFFITDADIEVPPTWIKGILSSFSETDGIVSGVTIVKGKSLLAKMQSFDWVAGFGMVKAVSDLNIPVSAVGNNMAIRKEAYFATGGYENLPFSVTEDYELFHHTIKRGYTFQNLVNKEVLAVSKPLESIGKLFRQRKRWMTGAFQLPIFISLCLSLQAIFLPVILFFCFINPVWGLLIWLFKIMLQQLFIAIIIKRINWYTDLLRYLLVFELYSGLFGLFMLVYYLIPTGIHWKGRKY